MKLSLRLLVPTLAIVLVAGAAALFFSPSIQAQAPPTCPAFDVCVESVEFTTDGPYKGGDIIRVTVTFAEAVQSDRTGQNPVHGTSTMNIVLYDPTQDPPAPTTRTGLLGGNQPVGLNAANPPNGSPSKTMVFTYTVNSATDGEGVVSVEAGQLGGDAINLENSDTSKSGNGNHDAATVSPKQDQRIDTTVPTLDSVTVTSSALGETGGTITVKVAFSEDMKVSGSPTLNLNVGGIDKVAKFMGLATDDKSVLVFVYTTAKGDGGEVAVPAGEIEGGTVTDSAGNLAPPSFGVDKVSVGDGHTVETDDAAPSVTYKPPSSLTVGIRIRAIMPKTDDDDISSYEITAGRLPRTLRFDESTGYITGRPTRAVAGPTRLTIKVCDGEVDAEGDPDPNCDENVTLTLPAILEDEDEEDVAAAVATLPAVPPVDLSDVSVGDAAPSSALQLALAATGGALLLGGIGVMTARRRARAKR